MSWISKTEALNSTINKLPHLRLDEKTIFNWLKEGQECSIEKKNHRIGFDQDELDEWHSKIEKSCLTLNKEDYLKCFRFGVRAYYQITRSDFNRVKQRDVGEFLTNQTSGKLGEIAVEKLLLNLGLAVKLDFDVTGQVASQDITSISTRKNVWNNPAVKVSIKSTKLKNVLLAVPENEATLEDRRSDLYILSQVGLFPNHILRLIKEYGRELLNEEADLISNFQDITVRIAGWIDRDTLTARPPLSLEEQKAEFGWNMNGPNYILRSGNLSTDWERLKNLIIGH